jgi:hypothetical protein
MLLRQDGAEFTTGRSRYSDRAPGSQEPTAKIFVKIIGEGLPGPVLAQLDTGAAWSILDVEVAEALGLLGRDGEPKRISTRLGSILGKLEQTSLEIPADEGYSLTIEAIVWVSPEWRAGNFLGYHGLLEGIRFAVDPSDNSFHFGSA